VPRDQTNVLDELRNCECEAPIEYVGALAEQLLDNESIADAVFGRMHSPTQHVLLVLTQSRLLGLHKWTGGIGPGGRPWPRQLYWSDVAKIDVNMRADVSGVGVRGYFGFNTPGWLFHAAGYGSTGWIGGYFNPDSIAEPSFRRLVEHAQAHLLAAKSGNQPIPPNGLADELERLATLRAQGLLTEEEYQAAKRKVLG